MLIRFLVLVCVVLPALGVPRPNILLIMSDDMGFSDIGCYGGEIKTPQLDSLAANGLRLAHFYNNARCCPTRASLLTGLYPHQAGVGHMMEDHGLDGYKGNLSRQSVTIAEVVRSAGYSTYMCGKWHLTRFSRPNAEKSNWPLQRGFDKFYGTIAGGGSFYDPTTLCRQNTYITPENDPEYKPEKFYYTDAISDNAIRFLQQHLESATDKPFFMYVAYTAAHWPMHALPEDIDKYKGKYNEGYQPIRAQRAERMRSLGLVKTNWSATPVAENWAAVEDKAWEARCMEVYAAMVDRMDQGIGRIVRQLKKTGQINNTFILFLQDNGGCAETMGRNVPKDDPAQPAQPLGPNDLQPKVWPPMQTRDGRWLRRGPGVMPGPEDTYIGYGRGWANVSNTPFREYKHWVHEGGISTPLILHWPAGIANNRRGTIDHHPAHLVDIMATCVDVAGAEYPRRFSEEKVKRLQGISLKPLMEGKPLNRKAPIFWEHEGNKAVRDGKWKLVCKADQGWELYDMEADRTEIRDLAASKPDIVERMSRQWEAWAEKSDVVPFGSWNARAKSINNHKKR